MAVINTGLLTRDARSEFLNRFAISEGATFYNDVATRIASTKDQENYKWLGSVPRMRQWGTGRQAKGLRSESYDVANLKYEATLEVDKDELSDDQTGQIRIRIQELAVAAATHKDYLISQLLVYGATAGYLAYDGLTFFNDAHVSGSSGNQDNDRTSDITDTAAPTLAELQVALIDAVTTMMAFKDDQGQPMLGMNTGGLVVVCPWNHYYRFLEVINTSMILGTNNVLSGIARVIGCPWLTTTTTWYLLKTDGIIRPFIFQDREPITFGALAEGSEEEFRREKYLYGVVARYRMTYGYWQYAIRHVFT